jgi:hypothetical protein
MTGENAAAVVNREHLRALFGRWAILDESKHNLRSKKTDAGPFDAGKNIVQRLLTERLVEVA